mgnify:CR=1 FL=1
MPPGFDPATFYLFPYDRDDDIETAGLTAEFKHLRKLHNTHAGIAPIDGVIFCNEGVGFRLHGVKLFEQVGKPIFPLCSIPDDFTAATGIDINDAKIIVAARGKRFKIMIPHRRKKFR